MSSLLYMSNLECTVVVANIPSISYHEYRIKMHFWQLEAPFKTFRLYICGENWYTCTLSNKKTLTPCVRNGRKFDGLQFPLSKIFWSKIIQFEAHLTTLHLVPFASKSVNYSIWGQKVPNKAVFNRLPILLNFLLKNVLCDANAGRQIFFHYICME